MKIAVGSDHAGFLLKEHLRRALEAKGHEVKDFGARSTESTDYPDYAGEVGRAVAAGEADRGILVCHTGVGMSIAANKVVGIRAAVGVNPEQVKLTRSHNDANVLTLGASFTGEDVAVRFADIFLGTEFDGGRHAHRLEKIAALENSAGDPEWKGR